MHLQSIIFFFFFFNDTATTEIYTLSLHDALPIYRRSVTCGDIGTDITRIDGWNRVPADVYVAARNNAVDLLQNIERHFLLGINERDDFELKHDLFVLDARRNSSCGSNRSSIRQGIYRNRDLLPRSDDSFFVVAGENGWPG